MVNSRLIAIRSRPGPRAMSEQTYDIQLRIWSHPRYLCVVRAVVESALGRLGFPPDLRTRMTMAVDEAVANVIRHGYDNRDDGPIWLTLEALAGGGDDGEAGRDSQHGGVRIVIEDEARQVEAEQIRGRDLAKVRPGGLGVHIIEQVMDHVQYEKRAERGMRLVMIRRYRGEASHTDRSSTAGT